MPTIAVEPIVHVAAGLLIDQGKVFIARRPADRHQGGQWEFPGGKLDPGESVLSALKRELHEELGIEVTAAEPFAQVRHAYPDRAVLLDVWRVTQWHGMPHGREGQEAAWVAIDTLRVADFPAADRPIVRRLQLPSLYLITDSRRFGAARFLSLVERAVAAGARLLQLREPQLNTAELLALACDVVTICRRHGAKLLINADPSVVAASGADGMHLTSNRLLALNARPLAADALVAASCHNLAELQHAQDLGLDFAVLGPVHPTASHPDAVVLGWENVRALCTQVDIPIYAIGGLRVPDWSRARIAGAHGLAMIEGAWGAPDIETVIANGSRDSVI